MSATAAAERARTRARTRDRVQSFSVCVCTRARKCRDKYDLMILHCVCQYVRACVCVRAIVAAVGAGLPPVAPALTVSRYGLGGFGTRTHTTREKDIYTSHRAPRMHIFQYIYILLLKLMAMVSTYPLYAKDVRVPRS